MIVQPAAGAASGLGLRHNRRPGAGAGSGEREANELGAIPILLERLAENDGLKGATVSIDAIACNGRIARNIRDAGADYLLAVKANQPTLRQEIEYLFKDAPRSSLESFDDVDKGHGRIEQRAVTVARDVDWLNGTRRFPGELRRLTPPPSSRSRARSSSRIAAATTPATTSPHPPPPLRSSPKLCEATGASKISSIGCSTSSSTRTNRVCERVTEPRTWQSCATSRSTSSGWLPRTSYPSGEASDARPTSPKAIARRQSSAADNSPAGAPTTSPQSYRSQPVNPDSGAWAVPDGYPKCRPVPPVAGVQSRMAAMQKPP